MSIGVIHIIGYSWTFCLILYGILLVGFNNNNRYMEKKYAIVEVESGEFYADPLYTDYDKGMTKIAYLKDYEEKHNMKRVEHVLEELTTEREAQHKKEWDFYVSMLD